MNKLLLSIVAMLGVATMAKATEVSGSIGSEKIVVTGSADVTGAKEVTDFSWESTTAGSESVTLTFTAEGTYNNSVKVTATETATATNGSYASGSAISGLFTSSTWYEKVAVQTIVLLVL